MEEGNVKQLPPVMPDKVFSTWMFGASMLGLITLIMLRCLLGAP